MTLKPTLVFAGLMAAVGAAVADPPVTPSGRPAAEVAAEPVIGTYTKAWLDLQKSGQMAEGEARPMDGEAAEASYQRYLDSFSHPIPQSLGRGESASSGSGSSAGAGASPAQ